MKKLLAKDLTLLGAGIILILGLSIISEKVFTRFDLTQEKRYTLTPETMELLDSLDQPIEFKIYLEGQHLPPMFVNLRNSIKELLDEYRIHTGNYIDYKFIDPTDPEEVENPKKFPEYLKKNSIFPVEVTENNGLEKQAVFPGAEVAYGNAKKYVVNFYRHDMINSHPEFVIKKSIESIEYELSNVIRKISQARRKKIAFLHGHGELNQLQTWYMCQAMFEYYDLKGIEIKDPAGKEQLNALDNFDMLVVAAPKTNFSEKELFVMDQFLMNGGRMLWMVDMVQANMDSLRYYKSTVALPNQMNIDGFLFNYGLRMNTNLLQDLQCGQIGVISTQQTSNGGIDKRPWIYHPVLKSRDDHIINRRLDLLSTKYVGSIDTLKGHEQLKKTVLLTSSVNTKSIKTPVQIGLQMAFGQPDINQFKDSQQPIAVLVEGQFNSYFKNRIAPDLTTNPEFQFKPESKPTKMIVIADGDFGRNPIRPPRDRKSSPTPMPLGYDRESGQFYDNKKFILNSVNYLLDDEAYIPARSRQVAMRLLNPGETRNRAGLWKFVNTGIPLIFLTIFGVAFILYRKFRFGR